MSNADIEFLGRRLVELDELLTATNPNDPARVQEIADALEVVKKEIARLIELRDNPPPPPADVPEDAAPQEVVANDESATTDATNPSSEATDAGD